MGGMMPARPPAAPSASAPQAAPSAAAIPAPEPAKVVCTKGGPYLCYGASIETATGGIEAPKDGKPLAICACGRSKTKPMCDGSHQRKAAAEAAPAPEKPID
jgi:CDGSH-type Zn-finger protein